MSAVVAAACSSFGATPRDDDGEAGVDGGAGADVPTTITPRDGGSACAIGKPFPSGTQVPVAGGYSVEAARFTDDPPTFAYVSLCPSDGGKAGCDLFTSRVSAGGELGAHSSVGAVNKPGYDSYATATADLNHLVFGSSRAGGVRIFVDTAVGGKFEGSSITTLALPSGATAANEPYVLAAGTILYFAAFDPNADEGWEIYRSEGSAPTFGPAAKVEGVGSKEDENAPVVTEDELEIFFASGRLGDDGIDVFTAQRSSSSVPFESPRKLTELSAGGNDWPVWISPDGCELYYIQKPSNVGLLFKTSRR